MTFPEEFPDCKIVKLEENFRSTQPILNLANEILKRGNAGG
jgi:DNA helicase-2/ATP-dependent DNA helicase PcrA